MLALALLLAIHLPPVEATVGVAAVDLDSGKTFSLRADERFPMGSVYKLPIGIAVLKAVDRGELALTRQVTIQPSDFAQGRSPIRDAAHGKAVTLTVAKLFDAMVSDSDNTAADVLQTLLGRRGMSLDGIRVDRTEKEIAADIAAHGVAAFNADERDTATPAAMVALLRRLHRREDGLSNASHDLLMKTLTESRNPRRMILGLPSGVTIAHKTGQMPGVLNDVGIITSADGKHHIAIAIFTKNARIDADEPRVQAIAEIARRVYDDFTH
jgi:beta-lactamase class A